MGSLYKRGSVWWIKFYRDGKPFRESSGSKSKRQAQWLLKLREGEVANGAFKGFQPERTTFDDLAEDLINDYLINERKALVQVKLYARRLAKHFCGMKAVEITTDQVRRYVALRRKEPTRLGSVPANASINRELSALKRMFNLGKQAGKVLSIPHIPMLDESRNVRTGFFRHEDYLRLRRALPAYLKPLVALAYYTGMRRGEILSVTWSQVDLGAGLIRLDPGTTKNKSGRTVPMNEELLRDMRQQREFCKRKFPFCRHAFFNHRTGRRIRDFRGAWDSACERAELAGALFHDLRRSGVRNLVRAGVPEKVAMAISGHKTRTVFDRYDIVRDDDLRAAAQALDSHLSPASRAQFGHNSKKSPQKPAEPIPLSR